MPEPLQYADGRTVQLGDQIRLRRFLRRPIEATIEYLSGASPANPTLEFDNAGLVTFAVRLPGDRLLSWTRPPGTALGRQFELLARGREGPV